MQRKHVCSVRYAAETMAVMTVLLYQHQRSFWTVERHTSPGDTNLGSAWWLLDRRRSLWHSPNGLGFAPVYLELRCRDLWMRHRDLAEVVSIACWMSEQGAAVVVVVEGGPYGNPEWQLPARRDTTGVAGVRGLAPGKRTVNDKASWIALPLLPSFLLIILANTDGLDSEPYNTVRVCNSDIIPTDEWQLRAHSGVLKTYKIQLEARAWDNVPDTTHDGSEETYYIEKWATVPGFMLRTGLHVYRKFEFVPSTPTDFWMCTGTVTIIMWLGLWNNIEISILFGGLSTEPESNIENVPLTEHWTESSRRF